MKLDKKYVERRVNILKEEGITFITGCEIGKDILASDLKSQYDAIVLCGGATLGRDLPAEGRELKGIHLAMEFLTKNTQSLLDSKLENGQFISADGKDVVVIGGGDTGSDCIGTSRRHGAARVTQLELLPKPPVKRTTANPWPEWPMTLRTSSSHEEGADRLFSVLTKEFVGNEKGELKGLVVVDIVWKDAGGRMTYDLVEGSERTIPCDLAFLAIGYLGPGQTNLLANFGVELMENNLPKARQYRSTNPKVFLAGDMRRGQSLVVWAISEGREAAVSVDEFLMGSSSLPRKDASLYEVEEQREHL
jgi:glutamate synthase (NADPH/NADH) small chain